MSYNWLVLSVFLLCFVKGFGKEAASASNENERKETIFLNHHFVIPGAPKPLTLLSLDGHEERETSYDQSVAKVGSVLHRFRRGINPNTKPEVKEVQ